MEHQRNIGITDRVSLAVDSWSISYAYIVTMKRKWITAIKAYSGQFGFIDSAVHTRFNVTSNTCDHRGDELPFVPVVDIESCLTLTSHKNSKKFTNHFYCLFKVAGMTQKIGFMCEDNVWIAGKWKVRKMWIVSLYSEMLYSCHNYFPRSQRWLVVFSRILLQLIMKNLVRCL